jgi:hypothetical protein
MSHRTMKEEDGMTKRLLVPLLAAGVAALVVGAAGRASSSTVRCVGGPKCFATLQAAVNAANDGDTIAINAGTFAGGVTITKSLALRGAGPDKTTIRGGGPVLTIGAFKAKTEPTVTIDGLTITDGLTSSSPMSSAFTGKENVFAAGGGIEVPPADGFRPGATVTITNSAIVGNKVAPTDSAPLGPPCPTGPCPFAGAFGGGIDTWGALTVSSSVLSGNAAAGVASDADGGAIASHLGALLLTNVRVAGNSVTAVAPNGRFAEGGGVYVEGGSLSVQGSVFDSNSASLTSNLPSLVDNKPIDMNANSGAIHVGDGIPTTIDSTTITHNRVSAVDPAGEPAAIDSGVLVNHSPLTMTNTAIVGNSVSAVVATSADVGPGGSALEADGGGRISNSRISDNPSSQTAMAGVAATNGGLAVLDFAGDPQLLTVDHTVISGNTAVATGSSGASALGGGVFNNTLLAMSYDTVTGNVARATGPTGTAQGGGIWNGVDLTGPPVELTLDHTSVSGNSVLGVGKIDLKGGGLFTNQPVVMNHASIAGNTPDQCFGC